jgi:hypothetical protein
MKLLNEWGQLKKIMNRSFASSFHYAVATVNADGTPHVTPIGSVILGKQGEGIFFDEFPARLSANIDSNPKICILAVDSNRWFWLRALIRGRFKQPPGVRLVAEAGPKRRATNKEIARWHKRVAKTKWTRGHAYLWQNMATVRDLKITGIEPINLGAMTIGAWK